ncbi:YrhA family protein [Sporosarcina cyprini]|uniref:YrhA family protein n=1 Tax=Sporosarcina cyprini TaxID=2910523 RepID=UPI001EE10E4B|nr:YrhA family protein [Sporosarcina cyprini]MCG3088317.1 YrhA family protein [Sporosarcina cyprini]
MVLELLVEIEKIKKEDGKTIMVPASDKDIQSLKEWISSNVRSNLWINEYGDFLKKVNGLDFNGLVIYNAKSDDENNGFISANEIWRDNVWDSNYLFFGDSSISWYCIDLESHVFLELDKPSGDVIEEYNNFEEMITEAIKSVL